MSLNAPSRGAPQEKDDQRLIRQISAHDQAAIGHLYDRYSGLVYSLSLRILKEPHEAEEIVSETFWQVWQQAHRYDDARGNVMAWIITIARSRALDALRARGRRHDAVNDPEMAAQTPAPTLHPDEVLWMREQRTKVLQALSLLPEAQRIALELAYFEGLSHSQIAEQTGEPLGTIKTRIRLGLSSLRAHLQPIRGD